MQRGPCLAARTRSCFSPWSIPPATHGRTPCLDFVGAGRGVFAAVPVPSCRRGRDSRYSVVAGVASPTRESRTLPQIEQSDEVFNWTKQWYPMMPLDLLEKSQGQGYSSGLPEIQRMSILGQDIVVWKDSEGKWRAVEDRCAHRLAALSLGSVQEDGTLACRYHGWCFNGHGECTRIPQAPDDLSHATACSSSRSKIRAFPTLQLNGLLWVWPDDSPTAWEDSAAQKPKMREAGDTPVTWTIMEAPTMSYVAALENTVDPLHAEFLHEGQASLAGGYFSPKHAIPLVNPKIVGDITAEGGFTIAHGGYNTANRDMEATRRFVPPCLQTGEYSMPNGPKFLFDVYFVPVRQGSTRILAAAKLEPPPKKEGEDTTQSQQKSDDEGVFKAIAKAIQALINTPHLMRQRLVASVLPKVVRVALSHHSDRVIIQDNAVLHSQDMALARSTKQWQDRYYLATPSDLAVAAIQKWMSTFSAGEPKWIQGGRDADAVLQRTFSARTEEWNRHSRWCPQCREALTHLGNIDRQLFKLALGFLGLGFVLTAIGVVNPRWALAASVVGVLSVFARFEVKHLRARLLTSIPSTGLPEMDYQWPS